MKIPERKSLTDAQIDERFARWLKADPVPVRSRLTMSRPVAAGRGDLSTRVAAQAMRGGPSPRMMWSLLGMAAGVLFLLGAMLWTLNNPAPALIQLPETGPVEHAVPGTIPLEDIEDLEEAFWLALEVDWSTTDWRPDEEDEILAQLFF